MQKFPTAQTQFRSILSMLQLMDQEVEIKQWRRPKDKGVEPGQNASGPKPKEPKTVAPRRGATKKAAPRFRFRAKVILHRNDRYIKGRAINISRSGMFIYSDRRIFRENEVVRIAIKPQGMTKYYKALARVVRYNENTEFLRGYGLQFIAPQRR